MPAAVARRDPPRAEGVREREGGRAAGAGDPPRRGAGLAGDGEVDVAYGAAEQAVAHGAADEPRLRARERAPRDHEGGRLAAAGRRTTRRAHAPVTPAPRRGGARAARAPTART